MLVDSPSLYSWLIHLEHLGFVYYGLHSLRQPLLLGFMEKIDFMKICFICSDINLMLEKEFIQCLVLSGR